MSSICIPLKRLYNQYCNPNRKQSLTVLNLPPELTVDILSRLPPKDLLRCLCVCKTWNVTILNQCFIDAYVRRSTQTNSFLTLLYSRKRSYRSTTEFFSLAVDEDDVIGSLPVQIDHPMKDHRDESVSVLGCSKGVVFLRYHFNAGYEVLYLWNPSIQKSERIPYPSFRLNLLRDVPTRNGYPLFGFGYDSVNEDFKIVGVQVYFKWRKNGAECSLVQIYSLKSKSWKTIQSLPCSSLKQCSGAVCSNGVLCWLIPKSDINTSDYILTLDLATEKYGEFPTPVIPDHNNLLLGLDVFGGCLCLHARYEDTLWDAWIMKEFGVKASWTLLCSLDCGARVPHKPLMISKNDLVLMAKSDGTLVWYDLVQRSVNQVESHCPRLESWNATICTGSLYLLDLTSVTVERQHNPPLSLRRRVFESVKKCFSTW